MDSNSPNAAQPETSDATSPEPSSTRFFNRSSGVIVAVAATCIFSLGACVFCGGGLAIPLLMRQRAAVQAERAAIDAQRAAMEQARYAEEAIRTEQEAMQKPEEGGESSTRPLPAIPGDGDHSTPDRSDDRRD